MDGIGWSMEGDGEMEYEKKKMNEQGGSRMDGGTGEGGGRNAYTQGKKGVGK